MNKILVVAIVLVSVAACSRKTSGGTVAPPPPPPPPQPPIVYSFETTPVWQDEFDYSGLPDGAKWGYDIGGHGWGNNELQYYTNSINNAKVDDGKLTITTIKEKTEGRNYSSARLVTKNKGDFLYGRVEVRAKLPSGRGTWPAIWMLPTDSDYGTWPKSGEIDIMEHVGFDPNKVHFTIHTDAYNHSKGTQKGENRMIQTAMTDFHLYRVDWAPDSIKGYFDNEHVFSFANQRTGFAAWPFDKRFHIILNTAVGGNWGGQQGIDDTVFPTKFEIDYVRVYKLKQ
jgi:beta-glucanase (GH16 family)